MRPVSPSFTSEIVHHYIFAFLLPGDVNPLIVPAQRTNNFTSWLDVHIWGMWYINSMWDWWFPIWTLSLSRAQGFS